MGIQLPKIEWEFVRKELDKRRAKCNGAV